VLSRSFSWAGDPASSLLPASQPVAAVVSVDLAWFPGAHVTEGAGSWFGVFGQGDVGLGVWARLGEATELEVVAGGQYALGLGELGTAAWFPGASAFSADANVGLAFPLMEHVRLRLAAQWLGTFVTLAGSTTFHDQTAMENSVTGTLTVQWAM
jgi:hypothetical protein